VALINLSYYAVNGMPLQHIWTVGKQVDSLHMVNQRLQLPMHLPAAVFSPVPLLRKNLPGKAYRIKELATYHVSRENPAERYYVYELSAAPADR
jgi:hypothetical protein